MNTVFYKYHIIRQQPWKFGLTRRTVESTTETLSDAYQALKDTRLRKRGRAYIVEVAVASHVECGIVVNKIYHNRLALSNV